MIITIILICCVVISACVYTYCVVKYLLTLRNYRQFTEEHSLLVRCIRQIETTSELEFWANEMIEFRKRHLKRVSVTDMLDSVKMLMNELVEARARIGIFKEHK